MKLSRMLIALEQVHEWTSRGKDSRTRRCPTLLKNGSYEANTSFNFRAVGRRVVAELDVPHGRQLELDELVGCKKLERTSADFVVNLQRLYVERPLPVSHLEYETDWTIFQVFVLLEARRHSSSR